MTSRTSQQGRPASRYCRRCGYCLDRLGSSKCPECGKAFDPDDRATFDRRPWHRWRRRAVRATLVVLLVAQVAFASAVLWLVHGWGSEQARIRRLERAGGRAYTDRVGPAWLKKLLGDRYGGLLDRAVDVDLQ